jgi:hypothetical protein
VVRWSSVRGALPKLKPDLIGPLACVPSAFGACKRFTGQSGDLGLSIYKQHRSVHSTPSLALDRCISDCSTLTHERCCKWGCTWLLTGDMRPSCSSSAHPSWHMHPQPHQQLSSHSSHTSQPSAGWVT